MNKQKCEICNGNFYIYDENKNVIICPCMQRKRMISVYKNAGIPLMFMDVSLNDFYLKQDSEGHDISPSDEKKKTIARKVIGNFVKKLSSMINNNQPFEYNGLKSSTIVLYGGKNSGKSMLAACIAKEALEEDLLSFFIEWSEIMNSCYDYNIDVQAENQLNTQKYEDLIKITRENKLIIIDNLDDSYEKQINQEKTTPSVRRKLDAMFTTRYKASMPTVFTSNQTPKELTEDEKYGPVLRAILKDAIYIDLPMLKKEARLKQVN